MKHPSVVVLNVDCRPINLVSWKRAIKMIFQGKAEIVEKTDRIIQNAEKTYSLVVPAVIKLVKFARNVYKAKVSFNKHNVMIRDRFVCGYCGGKHNLTIDHIKPVSKGGKTTWENCVTACKPCNSIKGNKLLEDTNLHLRLKAYHPSYVDYLNAKIEIFGVERLIN